MADNSNNFWTNPTIGADPKRNYRFRVSFTGNSAYTNNDTNGIWYAKKVSQPSITMTESTHDYLMHKYYWPAKATWSEVTMTLVDPVQPHVTANFLSAFEKSGMIMPSGPGSYNSISKAGASLQLGNVICEVIDEKGSTLHRWTLKHAWAKEISFTELDYSSENLMEITLKLRYDWAEFESGTGDSKTAFKLNPQ